MAGVSESYVSLVKKGSRNFTVDRLQKLEESLNLPLPLLLLESIDITKVPSELQAKYNELRQILSVKP